MTFDSAHHDKPARDLVDDDGYAHPIGRKLRSFDVDGFTPFDYPGVAEFSKAWKLEDLSLREIRVYLYLRDASALTSSSVAEIAEMLRISPTATLRCLRALERKGYARETPFGRMDESGKLTATWISDPTHGYADDALLFWEFGYLI